MKYIFYITTALLSALGIYAQSFKHGSDDTPLRKFQIAEMAISKFYVDSVDEQQLIEDAITDMLKNLDPHSSYTTAKESKRLNESLQGSFDGIGVQFNMVKDTLVVIQTITSGPSEKAGILAGDRITAANDTAISGVKKSREDIMSMLRGKKGSKVKLEIIRRGIPGKLSFIVTRDKIPLKTISASYMVDKQLGYIRIEGFGATTYKEFSDCTDSLRRKGMKNLILDLRDNGGGYMQAAIEIANEFLGEQDLIVYTQGRTVPKQEFHARGDGKMQSTGLYILINEYSASASEIVAGAMQDQDRATVIGRRSFGKGLVQRPLTFDDGSMLRLTIAHYYTPAGRCIQKPYEKGDRESYAMDIEKRFKHGELYNADSIQFSDSLKYKTLRRQKTVYGGGGIMPDVFVPLDSTRFTPLFRQLLAKGITIDAHLKYVDNNRSTLHKNFPSFDKFNRNFTVPETLTDSIMAEAEKQNIKPKDEKELKETLKQLAVQLKALIARDLWDTSEYFQVINNSDHIFMKALDIAKKK